MSFNIVENGPAIGTLSASYWLWQKTDFSNVVSRVRPLTGDEALKPTAYTRRHSFHLRAVLTHTDGSLGMDSVQVAPTTFSNEEYQSARKGVVTKLREKVKGESWNLSTFVGELPETLGYFKSTLTTLVRTYRAVKRGDLREVRRMIRRSRRDGGGSVVAKEGSQALSSKWLEWRYAIQPLMLDFDSMLKALYESSAQPRWTRAVTGGKFSKMSSVNTVGYSGKYSTFSGYTTTSVEMLTLRLGILYKVNPNVQAFKRLGLLNPVATLWELLPLSFVVDWFIPIGDYLSSLDAMAGVQVLSTWESRRELTENYVSPHSEKGWNSQGVIGYNEHTSSGSATKSSYTRTVNVSLSLPLPTFQLGLSAYRVTDAIALARSILGPK